MIKRFQTVDQDPLYSSVLPLSDRGVAICLAIGTASIKDCWRLRALGPASAPNLQLRPRRRPSSWRTCFGKRHVDRTIRRRIALQRVDDGAGHGGSILPPQRSATGYTSRQVTSVLVPSPANCGLPIADALVFSDSHWQSQLQRHGRCVNTGVKEAIAVLAISRQLVQESVNRSSAHPRTFANGAADAKRRAIARDSRATIE